MVWNPPSWRTHITKLDRDIARILSHLDTAVGRDNYAVVFTSDHGISDNVRAEGGRYNSGTFNAIQFRVLINSFLSARLGEGVWVSEYRNRQVYLNRRLIYERKLSLPRDTERRGHLRHTVRRRGTGCHRHHASNQLLRARHSHEDTEQLLSQTLRRRDNQP